MPIDKFDDGKSFSMLKWLVCDCLVFGSVLNCFQMSVQIPVIWQQHLHPSRIRNPVFSLMPLLRYSADWRSLFFLGLLSFLFWIQWTGWCRHWFLLAATCLLAFIACIIKHNHIHSRTFAARGWNRAFECFLSLVTGQSVAAIIPVHNERHHAQNHSEQDLVRSSVVNFRWNWLNLVAFPFAVVFLVHKNKSADMQRWRVHKPQLYRRWQTERALVWVFIGLLLIFSWWATLIYLGIPWIFGQWGIVTINLLQHQGCDHHSEYNHSRNITGRFLNWLFLNNGFHTAHHLRPKAR